MTRQDLAFPSGDGACAAWLWRPEDVSGDVPCVVMGHGFSLTRHDGLERYAEPLAAAGAAVLAFDHRFLGDSPGVPRQRVRLAEHREDWRAAIAFARRTDGVDARRIVPWGFSLGGGVAVDVAAEDADGIAALLLLCPFLDGRARALATPPRLSAWITPRAIADALGRHTTIPVTAEPGERAAMPLPGEADGFARTVAPGSPWRNRTSAQLFLTIAAHRPVRKAGALTMPVWAALGERDRSVSRAAIERLVRDAPQATLQRLPYDHFEPFAEAPAAHVAGLQAAWLREQRVLGDRSQGVMP